MEIETLFNGPAPLFLLSSVLAVDDLLKSPSEPTVSISVSEDPLCLARLISLLSKSKTA